MPNTPRLTLCSLALAALAVTAAACSSGPPADPLHDPSVRIPAIKRAVSRHDLSAAQQMVKDLRSDDPAIRLYAIEGLERLTGQTLGYHYYDPEPERLKAIKDWDEWIKGQQDKATAAAGS